MSSTPIRPTPDQIAAADPTVSAWVSANAGSGKTRVLTQRVARLLLAGAAPDRILCLTYTRAAAAEMQNRLFGMLGPWAMADDARLGQELAALAGQEAPERDPDRLARARRLFARALETPGGLKIQTIHAFCEAVLRRFPLEAGVSPRFEVMEERESRVLLGRLRGELAGADPAFEAIAARLNEGDVDALIAAVLARRDAFDMPSAENRLAALFGEAALDDSPARARAALGRLDRAALARHGETLARFGGTEDRKAAEAIAAARARIDTDPEAAAGTLSATFLTKDGTPRSRRGFPVKAVIAADADADALTDCLIAWAVAWREQANAAFHAARARDLDRFARALLGRYAAAKAARGRLDFDDLVSGTVRLLTRSTLRGWVLYKLDEGIEHILVDEAQDTAPAQWRIVEAIAEEFTAGAGAGAPARTLFAVGDEKQSIYSFQGADPEIFAAMRARFDARLAGIGHKLARPDLLTSFRSAPGVLGFVDAVFADGAPGLGEAPVRHVAHRAQDPARVDLWPLVEPLDKPERPDWWRPVDAPPPDSPGLRLAALLAGEIARMIREDTLPPRAGRPPRTVAPGDILVLVRARGVLDRALIRGLKARGVPVAGADRLTLGDSLAVQDLLSAIRAALTPADDLALAEMLRSPLADLSEEELFDLAHGRKGTLRRALMQAEARHPRAAAMLRDLSDRADYLRPYEFLERILIRHDGQRRLIARLGPEAADAIDEVLAQAMVYETREAPTLAGFLAWIEAGEITIKREMDRAGDAVRVMTVHGAKGLEAPVVIMPDTMRKLAAGRGPMLVPAAGASEVTLWLAGKARDDRVAGAARAAAEARRAAEERRLLYVGLTRAEDWLILCGAGRADQAAAEGRWYGPLADAMTRLGGVETEGPQGTTIRRLGTDPAPRGTDMPTAPAGAEAPPGWLRPAAREPRPKRPTPSALLPGGAEAAPGPAAGRGRAAALAHGRAVHLILERLADTDPPARARLAERLLRAAEPGMTAAARDAALAEAEAVFAAPFAGEIFGPDSIAEAGLALALPAVAGTRMLGRIDRLVVGADAVTVVDFKTDAEPPATPEAVAPAYLAQLGAYVAALRQVFAGRRVTAALLWSAGPLLMAVPGAALDAALAKAGDAPTDAGALDSPDARS